MTNINGYIYIRNHASYDSELACKLGKTNNIPERDTQYATGEIRRGYFEAVFEVSINEVDYIEILLQRNFCDLNIRYDAGTEFYNKKIIESIEPYLISAGIKYKKLTKLEIDNLLRCNRLKNVKLVKFAPRDYQIDIIEKSVEYYKTHDKGLLVLICGVGKTFISLWISQALKCNSIVIGVPNILLLNQWKTAIKNLFNNVPCLIVSSGVKCETINKFLNNKTCIVLTTYASSHKVYNATRYSKFVFDMKINDEAHHLTNSDAKLINTPKNYIQMLNIPSTKQISLTATLKYLQSDNDTAVISNDNLQYFGEIIDKKCLSWAINRNIVCDYVIQTIVMSEDQLPKFIISEVNNRLFLSAFASLKSMYDGYSHHVLIYCNNTNNSEKIVQYIKMLLTSDYFDTLKVYCSNYHSNMNLKQQNGILDSFEKSKFGIITCVYCLGEGYDNCNIDGVVFAENMSSNIRIVQSMLRAGRKNKFEPNKITKIILPILDNGNFLEDNNNSDLKKVKQVIHEIGLEDENIIQKIKVSRIDFEKRKSNTAHRVDEFGVYDDEMTKKLKLKTTKRMLLATPYENVKKIILDKNVKSKEAYRMLCDNDIRLPKDPEVEYKGKFAGWLDYLNVEPIYYTFDKCVQKIDEYLTLYPFIKKHCLDPSIMCKELCKLDNNFPPHDLWTEYYNVKDLSNIIEISNKKKKKSNIIV